MTTLRLADLTWTDVNELETARLVAILPVGAVEAHGPHLPLATDGIIALAMAEAGAAQLAARGEVPLLLPLIEYSAAPFAAAFPGTVSIRPDTLTLLATDVISALATHGVCTFVIANAHLDPAHLRSLHNVVANVGELPGVTVAFPDLTRRPWAGRLTDEFKSGACHAGRFEGSVILASRPDLVREAVGSRLAPNPTSLSEAIRAGKQSFVEAGAPQAYCGDPAAASAREGHATIEILGGILADAVVAL